MAKHVFVSDLSVKGLNNLIKKLENYRDNILPQKLSEFTLRLAEVGIPIIEKNMSEASYTYDEKLIQSGADTSHNTYIKLNSFGNYAQANLIVEGRELLFIEFGSGVYNNTEVGTSPHPKGEEFGFLIGSYGMGKGAQKVWGYYADSGELVLTHGVKATMPMYEASLEIINSVVRVAREVFG